jgi:NitT/TauT family transport system permease protein
MSTLAESDASRADPLELGDDDIDVESPRRRWVLRVIAPIVGIATFLGLWQLLCVVFGVEPYVLAKPSDILDHIFGDLSFYARNARITLWEASLGFVIAFVLAMIGATAMALSPFVERAMLPIAVVLQVTPIIVYAPAVVIWLGFGLKPILLLTVVACYVPFLLNGVAGLRSVDPNLLELARSVDARRTEVFWRLRFPSSLPYLFSAARIAVGLALIGAVLGEFFAGSTGGLGWAVKTAQAHNLPLQLWGSTYVLAFLGSLAVFLIGAIERATLHWHSSQRS